jgi:hypothetical protein
LKDEFQDLKETIIDSIKTMVMEEVLKAGVKWILSLLNPVAALFKAIKAIIDIVIFFVTRASQIMELVRAFVESIKAVASGALGKVSSAIENALAKAIPVVIGFLAAFLGLNKVADKAMDIIRSIRNRVEKAIDKVILKVSDGAQKLFGKEEGKKAPGDNSPETNTANLPAHELQDSVVGETVTFTAGKDSHQLWVKETSGGVDIYISNETMSVGKKIKDVESKIENSEERERLKALLSNAKNQYETAKIEANQAGQSMSKAKSSKADAAKANKEDSDAEMAEQKLGYTLSELLPLIGDQDKNMELREEFVIDSGQSHELYFEKAENGDHYEAMIASGTGKPISNFLNRLQVNSVLPDKVAAKNELINTQKLIESLSANKRPEIEFKPHFKRFAELTAELFSPGKSSIPRTHGTNEAGFGVKTIIDYLVAESADGLDGQGPSNEAHTVYDIINARAYGRGKYYVRGHLLSESLNGPGGWDNLTPLRGSVNTAGHEKFVERSLKEGVKEVTPGFTEKNAYSYEVTPIYGRGVNSALIQKIRNSNQGMDEKKFRINIVEMEQFVPNGLSIKAEQLNPLTLESMGALSFPSISNVIDQSNVDFKLDGHTYTKAPLKFINVTQSNLEQYFTYNEAQLIMKIRASHFRNIKSSSDLYQLILNESKTTGIYISLDTINAFILI